MILLLLEINKNLYIIKSKLKFNISLKLKWGSYNKLLNEKLFLNKIIEMNNITVRSLFLTVMFFIVKKISAIIIYAKPLFTP